MTNLLLLAKARGCRIQELFGYNDPMWGATIDGSVILAKPDKHRINPLDTDLRFGPISMAMYDAVKYSSTNAKVRFPISYNEYEAAGWFLADPRGKITYMDWLACNEITRDLFLLFMAEVFFWEGL